jgi:WD40 repeat protein
MGSRVLRTSDESLVTDLETYFLGSITNLAFTPDGRQIIVATGYKHLYLYPVESTSLNSPQVADPKTYIPILAAAVSHPYPDDQIEVTSPDHRFMARRDKGLVTLFTWSGTGQLYTIPVYRVRRLTFSPDGQILALGLRDGTVVLWDVEKNRNIYNIPTRPSDRSYSVGGLAFSPDGKLLAIGLEDGTVRLFGIEAK